MLFIIYVKRPEDYIYSGGRDYEGAKGFSGFVLLSGFSEFRIEGYMFAAKALLTLVIGGGREPGLFLKKVKHGFIQQKNFDQVGGSGP